MRRVLLAISIVALALPLAGAAAPGAAPIQVLAKISVGKKPCTAAAGFGAVWVTNYGQGTVRVIDPARNRTIGKAIKVGSAPCGIVTGGGAVWVNEYGTNRVVKINPRKRKVAASIRVGDSPFDVLYAAGSVWSSDNGEHEVSRINPRTNRVVKRIPTGAGAPAGFVFAAGAVWVGDTAGETIFRIDPATNRFVEVDTDAVGPAWLAATETDIWASHPGQGVVTRMSTATNSVVARITVGGTPVDGVIGPDGLVWIPDLTGGVVHRIDPATNAVVDRFAVGRGPFVLTVGYGDVWAPAYGGTSVWRLRVGS
jgi:YVTN family beta-propeller protein